MLQSKPDSMNIDDLEYLLEKGELKVPQFQREFVWDIKASARLMDSILKGYPIGAFTFWKTKERLRSVKNIGGIKLPDSPPNDYVNYVLDGQQRITSIYACIKGVIIDDISYKDMYIDLLASEDEEIVTLDISYREKNEYISIVDLLTGNMTFLVGTYGNNQERLAKIEDYKGRLQKYVFSTIEIKDAPLDIATEIFTRINTTGKPLSVFEIMCAKCYDEKLKFDLYEERNKQIEKWENVSFDTVPHQTVLQVMSLCIQKSCKRRDILNIDKKAFIEKWKDVDKAFDAAIDYVKSFFGIPVSKLLPYDALLVPIVYFFYYNKKKPDGTNAKRLQDYFWRCVLSKRFTEGVEGKLALDCQNVIEPILNDENPDIKNLPSVDITAVSIEKNGVFSMSSAYVKGLICILAAQHPKSFSDGAEVAIDNAWLSQSNSKNYHHFFPKAYMKKHQHLIDEDKVNHIANITIVDGYLNKNLIREKAPAVYMKDFLKKNDKIQEVMNTHLITDLKDFGVWENDYNLFFEKRIDMLKKQLEQRVILHKNYDLFDKK